MRPTVAARAPVRAAGPTPSESTRITRPLAGKPPIDCWLPDGVRVDIAGLSISGGMLYVGSHLPAANGNGADPALIVPNLPVDLRRPDLHGASMSYWPSYSRIAPAARGAYLRWLAGGRSDPNAYIGYVFLYFYGLERRLLVDSQRSPQARAERDSLIAEVRRLLSIYHDNGSFRGYAQALLDAMVVLNPPPRPERPPAARQGWSPDLSLELRIGLAQLCAEGTPVPADWALAWVTQLPDAYLRTPATRCPEMFQQLFAAHYRERYGAGVVLRPGARSLSVSYHAASGGIGGLPGFENDQLTDVSSQVGVISTLRDLVERATTELDPYSRYLGRHPEGADDSAAIAVLPATLTVEPSEAVRALWWWATATLDGTRQAVTSTEELFAHWPDAPTSGKLSKADLVVLAQLLDRKGIGIEPDARFGGNPPATNKPIVLFHRATQQMNAPSPQYPAALAAINLGMLVAAADGVVSEREMAVLRAAAIDPLDLSADERLRLEAHAALVAANPPTPAVLRRRLSTLSDQRKAEAGQFLISIAAVDGDITADEVRQVESLFRSLGLDPSEIYASLHAAAITTATAGKDADDEPVAVRTTGTAAPRVPLPRPEAQPASTRTGLRLDPALLAAKRAESARAAAQLAAIFADEEPDARPVEYSATATNGDVPVAGLDTAHSELFRLLVGQDSWRRADVERMAADLGLLPDGALDMLNEAALDHTDGPLWEGHDPIIIDLDTAKDMHG